MTTSVNQPRSVQNPSTKNLYRSLFILAALVIGTIWFWNSWNAGKPIPLSQPLPKATSVMVAVAQSGQSFGKGSDAETIEAEVPIRCIDIAKPIKLLPGKNALTIRSSYVPCEITNKAVYTVEKQEDGYLITSTTRDSDQFLCGGVPTKVGDLAQCKVIR